MGKSSMFNELKRISRESLVKIAKKKQIGITVKRDFKVKRWADVKDDDLINKIAEICINKGISIEDLLIQKTIQKTIAKPRKKPSALPVKPKLKVKTESSIRDLIDKKINHIRQEFHAELNILKRQIDEILILIENRSIGKFEEKKSRYKKYKEKISLFYKELKREFNNIPYRERVGIRAPIYILRNSFCNKNHIEFDEFNELVIKLRNLGKIGLQPGAIGERTKVLSSSEADYYWISFKG